MELQDYLLEIEVIVISLKIKFVKIKLSYLYKKNTKNIKIS